ncbi:alpha/beta hydrolase-fold protein [Microbulbifer sp. OS29]|uniref:Alpha/beta hydrolase-fold protein n=1 Tax=Microbulbifer okhotskensis TaxID=2926617 RepID=A0A9X2J7R0_9GAMM|nr:alpha/beta hydrolase-fold protein [Microbulbifer okhotskensis]MCO1336854.1 alpha/beta hydrolase-fold protein [Microbulbifer okhotskensis]
MKIIKLLVIGILAIFSQMVTAGSAEPATFTRPGILSYHFYSDLLEREYVIDVMLPLSYTPENNDHYPVIYMTDGFLHFPMTAPNLLQEQVPDELGNAKMPPVILVGISHAFDNQDFSQRVMDLTPVPGVVKGTELGGGADRFLDFIEEELKPFINNSFKGNEEDETLVGHSLGGLLALHALFNHTNSFDRYVIGSPSIWWADKQILESELAYAERNSDLAKNVYLFIGGEEKCNEVDSVCGVKDLSQLVKRLKSRNYNGLTLKQRIFDNENHGSVVNPGYDRGIEKVFKAKLLPRKYSF